MNTRGEGTASPPRRHIAIALCLCTIVPCCPAEAADAAMPSLVVGAAPGAFAGDWTYRSYVSDPNQATPPNALLFGIGRLHIVEAADGSVTGTLGGTGWSLALVGTASYGSADSLRIEGSGEINGEHWVYDYFAYLAPDWTNGVQQVPALLGTVVRTVPHNHGQAAAGVVASFIAVRAP